LPAEDQGVAITEGLLEETFHAYYEGLHRYAYTILKDDAESKDVVQRVFIRLWENRERIRIRESFKPYLFRSVYNLCINVRTREREPLPFLPETQEIPGAAGPDLAIECKELQARIDRAIGALPPKCGAVFRKSRMEGKSYAQIAKEEEISIKTVEAQLSRALRLLKKALGLALLGLIIAYYLIKSTGGAK
jgi:RNA polymerase sigma-70 factor (ECF subfamily)